MSIPAYPLQWPLGYPRTTMRLDPRFRSTFAQARDKIIAEVKRLGGTGIVISTNIPIKNDGFPYASFKTPSDQGAAVYFTWKKKQMVLACDKWNNITANLVAIHKTIDAIRGIERWGVSDFLERSFTGFEALPQNAESNNRTWYEVLGVNAGASDGEVKSAYRKKVNEYHPDKPTGNRIKFEEVQGAMEQYKILFEHEW